MSNVVGERFQITIDKRVREQLGVKPGDQAVERVEDGMLVVTFLRPHSESMLGIIKKVSDVPIEPITDWQAVREDAWALRVDEIMEALDAQPARDATGAQRRDR